MTLPLRLFGFATHFLSHKLWEIICPVRTLSECVRLHQLCVQQLLNNINETCNLISNSNRSQTEEKHFAKYRITHLFKAAPVFVVEPELTFSNFKFKRFFPTDVGVKFLSVHKFSRIINSYFASDRRLISFAFCLDDLSYPTIFRWCYVFSIFFQIALQIHACLTVSRHVDSLVLTSLWKGTGTLRMFSHSDDRKTRL